MTTILLIDDDESNVLTLSALLEDEGFKVHTAMSCAEGRSLLTNGPVADAVLLDLHLPDGLGSTLVPLIRDRHPLAAIVWISGSLGMDEPPETVDACFPKGGSFTDLVALLRKWMRITSIQGD